MSIDEVSVDEMAVNKMTSTERKLFPPFSDDVTRGARDINTLGNLSLFRSGNPLGKTVDV